MWKIAFVMDDEEDIGFQFLFITFIKYREYVIVEWFKAYPLAPRYVEEAKECSCYDGLS